MKKRWLMLVSLMLLGTSWAEEGFESIFNGENFEGWYLKIRSGDAAMAKKVFTVEESAVHVFNDQFPDPYKLDTGENDTHGLFYCDKQYTNYVLRFEYKWGKRRANNFARWQYDAGVYYHVSNDAVWPVGIEYQIRYDDGNNRSHTGDLIRPTGAGYDWYAGEDGTYLHPDEGGKIYPKGWLHYAAPARNYHALDDQWNACEIIVMGGEYAIHKLNGEVVNMAFNLKPSSGNFGFQAETAEIFYRNIRVKEYREAVPASEFLVDAAAQ